MGFPLTLSAGLVIADVKYPVHFLANLAEGALKEAKGWAKALQEQNQSPQSTLCHLWLRAPVASENAKEILEALYRRKGGTTERWLTARPFTLAQAQQLTCIAENLKELPAAQRRMFAEALERGVYASLNLALYQVRRRAQPQMLQAFEELGKLLDGQGHTDGFYFWRRKGKVWRTALLDALELIELRG